MRAETSIPETPPLDYGSGRSGEQACGPLSGNRAKRLLHGVINSCSGDVLVLSPEAWVQETPQAFLAMIRSHGRGWHLSVCEDRGSPHTTATTLALASALHIELRFFPKATPEVTARDQLWRHVKGQGLANRPTRAIDDSADVACRYILQMRRHERLCKAGVFSGNFWLTL
jgi:hypothetical protein